MSKYELFIEYKKGGLLLKGDITEIKCNTLRLKDLERIQFRKCENLTELYNAIHEKLTKDGAELTRAGMPYEIEYKKEKPDGITNNRHIIFPDQIIGLHLEKMDERGEE